VTESIAEEKAALRKEAKGRRKQAEAAVPDAAKRFARLLPDLPECVPVSAFWPMGQELDVRPAMQALHERGHDVGLPAMPGPARPLIFRRWQAGMTLVPAAFGTSEPPAEAEEIVPQVLIVPLLAFDRAGFRLGYGGGFYDRTLAILRPRGLVLAIGAAYAAQEVAAVPREETDLALDWIVTERESIRISTST